MLKLSFINITQFWMTPDCASEVFLDKRTWILQERKPEIRVCLSQVYFIPFERKRFICSLASFDPKDLTIHLLYLSSYCEQAPRFITPGLKSLSFLSHMVWKTLVFISHILKSLSFFITHDLKNLSFYHTSFEKPQFFVTHGLKNLDLLSHVVWKKLVFTTRGLKSLSFLSHMVWKA